MILLVDNYDSFVFNLARYFERLGHATRVVRIDAIGPAKPQETAATDRGEALKQKVLKRAEQIRRAWKDVPQAPAPKPDHTEEPDETGALEDEETREAA